MNRTNMNSAHWVMALYLVFFGYLLTGCQEILGEASGNAGFGGSGGTSASPSDIPVPSSGGCSRYRQSAVRVNNYVAPTQSQLQRVQAALADTCPQTAEGHSVRSGSKDVQFTQNLAQGFEVQDETVFREVSFEIYRKGNFAGTLVAEIRTNSTDCDKSDNCPSNQILSMSKSVFSFDITNTTNNGDLTTFEFNYPPTLQAGQTYWVVIRGNVSADSVYFMGDDQNPLSGGHIAIFGGDGWEGFAGWDLNLQTQVCD